MPTTLPLPDDAASQQDATRGTLRLLTPVQSLGFHKTRIGGSADGGYIMVDDFPDPMMCYSIGIGNDVSWDLDMAQRGAQVFQYDHTVERAPMQHESFHFSRIRVGATDGPDASWRRLDSILQDNGHVSTQDLILKMDIEDGEWEVLESLETKVIAQFRQILLEVHYLSRLADPIWAARMKGVFRKLRTTHMPVHVHGNNHCPIVVVHGVPFPDVLELSYASRAAYSFAESREIFPGTLDRPNERNKPDLFLGNFSF